VSLEIVRRIAETRDAVTRFRRAGHTIGLVPTMGALHEGHRRLIETARAECGCVVVSIFVNPIQFNRTDDYERYPRALDADTRFCEEHGADLIFVPEISEMYPRPQRAFVEVERLTEHLCGKFRPGHLRGVTTVVAKLFNIVQPDRAYFGEKDAQQLAVIRRMAADLNMPVEIIGVPTVREANGLALSSRNQHLTPAERENAAVISCALRAAEAAVRSGARTADEVRAAALSVMARRPEFRVEYFEIVDVEELQPVNEITGPVLVATAVWAGTTRLIDNVMVNREGD